MAIAKPRTPITELIAIGTFKKDYKLIHNNLLCSNYINII